MVKNLQVFSAGDLGSIPGLGRSPRDGKGYPLQYPGLEKSMDIQPTFASRSPDRMGSDSPQGSAPAFAWAPPTDLGGLPLVSQRCSELPR